VELGKQNVPHNNAVQVAGLDRICFAPWPSTPPPVLRAQQATKIDLRVFFAYTVLLQVSGHELRLESYFS
jgi:hypothetical protein